MTSPIVRDVTIGNCRLIQGDCLEVMPLLGKVDAVVTDPPYGINGGSGTVGKLRAHKHNYASFVDTEENIGLTVIPAVAMALEKADGRGVVTPGPKCFLSYPKPSAFGSFYQPATAALNLWGRASSQPIFYYGRPPRLGKDIGDTTYKIDDARSDGGEGHPCPKPLKSMKQLVSLASNVGQTILDPFMGSGTTLVACAKLGRHGIGIEIDPDYFDIACERVRKAYEQPDMFIAQPEQKPVQEPLL
jgi:DNA modification methylase